MKKLKITPICLVTLHLMSAQTLSYAQLDETKAEDIVKNTPCNKTTIEEVLQAKIKTGSQRDLGWQVFKEGDQFEAERAFLMNKSMQLRFRWRINPDGISISPVSKRAEILCEE
jgi:hypothetical protein